MELIRPLYSYRSLLRKMLATGYSGLPYLSRGAWCLALEELGVKSADTKMTLRHIIDWHLERETDPAIECDVLHANWSELEAQRRLSAAVWSAIALQLRWGSWHRYLWVDLPNGRRMEIYSDAVHIFDRSGKLILQGSIDGAGGSVGGYRFGYWIRFFAQRSTPKRQRHRR
jgi:hypothetical protein